MIGRLLSTPRRQLIAACAALAVATLTTLLLWIAKPLSAPSGSDAGPIEPRVLPSGIDLDRELFKEPVNADSAPPPDAPVLAGIAGRLPDGAVAMVRDDDGRTRTVAIGQTHRGWRLESLSGDAALFRRGTQQVRIALPASEEEPVDEEASVEGQ